MKSKKLVAVVLGSLMVFALSLPVMAQSTTQSTSSTTTQDTRPQDQTTQTTDTTTKYKHHHHKVKQHTDTTTTNTEQPRQDLQQNTTTLAIPKVAGVQSPTSANRQMWGTVQLDGACSANALIGWLIRRGIESQFLEPGKQTSVSVGVDRS